MKFFRWTHTLLLLCVVFGFILGYLEPKFGKSLLNKTICPHCNIIVISIDPLRADELPCLGYIYNTTPNLCRFANRSISFTNAISQSSWTLPSIMSLITSQYPYEHGMVIPYQSVLAPDTVTLPQVLETSGYATTYIGDIDNSHLPLDKGLGRGFQSKVPYQHSAMELIHMLTNMRESKKPLFTFIHNFNMLASWRRAAHPPSSFLFDPKFTTPPIFDTTTFLPQTWRESIYYLEQNQHLSDEYKRILSLLKNANSIQHAYTLFKLLSPTDQETILSFSLFEKINMYNPQHVRLLRNLYDEKLFETDQALSPLLDTLSRPPWDRDTIIVIVSNHGDELGEHGRMSHGTNLFRSTTHIPMIIRIPNLPPKNISTLVASIDVFPTVLDAVGINAPSSIRGESLIPMMQGTHRTKKQPSAVSQLGPFPWISSIQTPTWSYYEDKSDSPPEQLFNLINDPNEQTNVIAQFTQVAHELKQKLYTINSLPKNPYNASLLIHP